MFNSKDKLSENVLKRSTSVVIRDRSVPGHHNVSFCHVTQCHAQCRRDKDESSFELSLKEGVVSKFVDNLVFLAVTVVVFTLEDDGRVWDCLA